MAIFRHGKDIGVMLARWNLSPYLNAAKMARNIDMADSTTFGNQDKTFIIGEADGKGSLKGYLSQDAGVLLDVNEVMESLVGGPRTYSDFTTNTDTSLVSARSNFTKDDVGAPVSGTNIFAGTVISSVTNGTTVVLSHVTTGTGVNGTVTIGSHSVGLAPFCIATDAGFIYGNRVQVGVAYAATLERDSSVSGIAIVNCDIQASGGARHGRILSAALEVVAATANGVGLLDAGNAATVCPFATGIYLFIPVNTRNGTVDVKVQHSPDNASWADLGTFTTVPASTAVAQQVLIAANTTINKYLRVVYTVAGSTGSASILVVASRR